MPIPRHLFFLFSVLLLLACLVLPDTALAADSVAATVVRMHGPSHVLEGDAKRLLSTGDSVLQGQTLATGGVSRLALRMADGGELTLGGDTVFTLHSYLAPTQPGTGEALMELARGAFLMATGALADANSDAFRVDTPLGTIGIRGTTFWGGHLDHDPSRVGVLMLSGKGVIVRNAQGRAELTQAGQGTWITGPGVAPKAPEDWAVEAMIKAKATVAFPD